MPLEKFNVIARLILAASISGAFAVTNLVNVSAADAPTDERGPSWVDQRIADWELSQAERRFDEIGWAGGLGEAECLARESERPLFVFTYSGSATEANAIALRRC